MSTFWEKSADPRKGETVLHNMAGNLLLKVTRKWKKKTEKSWIPALEDWVWTTPGLMGERTHSS